MTPPPSSSERTEAADQLAGLWGGIVRILEPGGETAGAGFVVRRDGLLATCSHVVQSCKAQAQGVPRPDSAAVAFHATGEVRSARVVPEGWLPCQSGDVALLLLEDGLPDGVDPLPLGLSPGLRGHRFWTYGFPQQRPVEGLHGYGTIGDAIRENGQMLFQLRDATEVTAGFSGAPIFDETTRRVIGMVTSITRPDRYGRGAETAFITPVETLFRVCTDLQASDLCPYRGLDAFTEADAEFFHGRDRGVRLLLEAVRRSRRFLAVLGPSGSGKSSLVRAGLIVHLRRGAIPGSERWGVVVSRPADSPLNHLEQAGLPGASRNLAAALETWFLRHPDRDRLVIVFDQFEEVLVSASSELRAAFLDEVGGVLEGPQPITVVLVMRDEFYSSLADKAPSLMRFVEQGLVNLPHTLEPDELAAIVAQPASSVGLNLDEGLTDEIVHDALEASATEKGSRSGRSTVLPLLEFALTQLWERRRDSRLTHEAYERIGRVTGSLAEWCDRAYRSLNEERRTVARRILTDLVSLRSETEGMPDTRRRRLIADLLYQVEDEPAVREIVSRFADARIVLTARAADGGAETVELIHDALLREWGELRGWLGEGRLFLSWHQAAEQRAKAWLETALGNAHLRDPGRLLRGRDLAEAARWRDERQEEFAPAVHQLVTASLAEDEQQRRREHRRVRLLAGLASGLVVLVILTAGLAVSARQQAERADAAADLALSRQIAVTAISKLAEDPELSLMLSLEAASAAHSDQAEAALSMSLGASHVRLLLDRHPDDAVNSADYSKDGRLVVTASDDGTARIWKARTGVQMETLGGVGGAMTSAAFNDDGNLVVTGSEDGFAYIWDASTGDKLHRLEGHKGDVTSVAFSPDGRLVVTGSEDATARIWDASTGDWVLTLRGHEERINSVAFSPPDGELVATASKDNTARLWNAATGDLEHKLDKHTEPVWEASFSGDGKRLVTAGGDITARIWDVLRGRQMGVLNGLTGGTNWFAGASFSPDGEFIVTSHGDYTAHVWDAKSHDVLLSLQGHQADVWTPQFSPDGRRILTASFDGTARIWDATAATSILRHEDEVTDANFSPKGKWLVLTSTEGGTVTLWDLRTTEDPRVLADSGEPVGTATFSRDGALIVTAGEDGTARVYDASSGQELSVLDVGKEVSAAAFHPDDASLVATADEGGFIGIWDWRTEEPIRRMREGEGELTSVSFTSKGDLIVTSSEDKNARIWDVATEEVIQTLEGGHREEVANANFSPDGSFVVTAGDDDTAMVWDASSGRPLYTLSGHRGAVHTAVFDSRGEFLVTASQDHTTRTWDASNGRELTRSDNRDAVNSAAFSVDRRFIVTASRDTTARIQPCYVCRSWGQLLELAYSRVTREFTEFERGAYL